MVIDFKHDFGVNAGYVENLYQQWQDGLSDLDPEWVAWFERLAERAAVQAKQKAPPKDAADAEYVDEPLRGVAARIAQNMSASLEVPTATTVRSLPVKVLAENRRTLNQHLRVRALGKASYTHLIAYAMVRAIQELPNVQSACIEEEGRLLRRRPKHVNLGLAIDIESEQGRNLVVPNIRHAEAMSFQQFLEAYEDLVRRARKGELKAADFQGTTVSLTNPGGFGTQMSVPRLMAGQGLIVAVGSIGVPAETAAMSPDNLARMAIGPVMTVTSTYDHRVIQGAESGLLLRRIEQLLQGEDGFYDEIFRVYRVPWRPAAPSSDSTHNEVEKQAKVWQLINAYRVRGHRIADLDPLEYSPDLLPSLDPAWYGLTLWDLDREFLAGDLVGKPRTTLREILDVLRDSYCRRWTIEYMHISDRIRKHWIRERIEPRCNEDPFDPEHRVRVLTRLSQAENFERFLHTRYVGNKRFSLEGADSLIPAIAELIDHAADQGVEMVVIGMAHRGRLNVLANILGKSHQQIFREFEGQLLPLESEGSGDVKYHLGQRGVYVTPSGKQVEVVLSANPSHLEAVDPVVCGMTRGYQDERKDGERRRVLAVLVHGDAAFSGQGVVAETLNMSALPGYDNGGTVHLILNNQIGFTAGPRDLRSTHYCSDMAKAIEAPILHANGDYPEAVLKAVHVAVDYQREFGRDVVVDMVCYRRWGHNEGDEPAFTQPSLYRKIREHATVRENYTALLVRRGAMTAEECEQIGERFNDELREAIASFKAEDSPEFDLAELVDLTDDDPADWWNEAAPTTGVEVDKLVEIVDRLNAIPHGHVTHPNLLRQLRRREEMVRGDREIDWGCAEALAFGTMVETGVGIRLVGQDSGRGTFSHRHAVIRDQVTDQDYIPLAELASSGGSFEVHDSLLSEEAALAYEYGYSIARPTALALWEAQFGDFVNGAQIPIDQFLVPGEAKWKQRAGVTLLLPHGYDGQGPEHSSGRIERFLTACSSGNITVAIPSTSAQYFHLLRRQGAASIKRPLIVFTPKSLLRDRRAASAVDELASGAFQGVVDDVTVDPTKVKRVVLCSGKVYFDLNEHRQQEQLTDVAVVRVEQLYPFPRAALANWIERCPEASWHWCQEEPRNMGAWAFMLQRFAELGWPSLTYAGRPSAASPATGSYKRHQAEQAYLIRRAFA